MMAGVVFKSNKQQVKAQLERNIAEALQRIGLTWINKVSPLVPVDTSRLVQSMTFDVDIDSKKVILGTPVEYAPFVELGTSKMAAQPYLRPSIMDHLGEYEKEIKKALGQGWSVSVK